MLHRKYPQSEYGGLIFNSMNLKVLFGYAQVHSRIYRVLNTLRSPYGEAHAFYDETHGPYGQAHGLHLPLVYRNLLKRMYL